jgi:hypothetical protein
MRRPPVHATSSRDASTLTVGMFSPQAIMMKISSV